MSRKQDFLKSEQSRDKHPGRVQAGGAAKEMPEAADPDKQPGHTGKVANDHNKAGHQAPTQKNEARRTPESRHDRQSIAGGPQNQVSARKGGNRGGAG